MLDEIVGEAANILETLPPLAKVYITSGDVEDLLAMEREFKEYLISDVVFLTPQQILDGHLRGKRGILLITGTHLMPNNFRHCVFQEQEILKCELIRGEYV